MWQIRDASQNANFYLIHFQVVPVLLLWQRRRLPHEHGRHHRQPVSLENVILNSKT